MTLTRYVVFTVPLPELLSIESGEKYLSICIHRRNLASPFSSCTSRSEHSAPSSTDKTQERQQPPRPKLPARYGRSAAHRPRRLPSPHGIQNRMAHENGAGSLPKAVNVGWYICVVVSPARLSLPADASITRFHHVRLLNSCFLLYMPLDWRYCLDSSVKNEHTRLHKVLI